MEMTAHSGTNEAATLLPDGTRFAIWEDETVYRKTYYVDQQHPDASDDNPGTEKAPFLTIQRAAEAVGPAEKVLIKSGVYRERVHPLRGGTGADGMIAFEAAPGAEAVIRGSRVLTAPWTNMEEPNSVHVWRTELPGSFFAGDHPFAVINTTDEDFELMRWARGSKGKAPHNLPRALIFQDGRRLTQLSSIADLARIAGAFWIDSENRRLYVNPFDGRDPHTCEIEATAQQFLFCPQTTGLGYIAVRGLTFEHAGNGFIRSGNGALAAWGGHHWIIEENTVRHINSVGIEIGGFTDERAENEIRQELEERTGGHLVRRNHVYDCGTGGIQGTLVPRSLLAGNHIHDCGWHEVQSYQETAGIKILLLRDTVVQCNHIHHCYAAPGIWIDFGNRNSRVCRNLLHDIATFNGAIFFEASNVPNLIDHNVIYNVKVGSGVYQRDCDQLLIAHNLVRNCGHAGIHMRKTPTRDRVGVCKENRVINNILVQCSVAFDYEVMENVSDNNILSCMGEGFRLEDWQESGLDTHSRNARLDLVIDPGEQLLDLSSADAAPAVPRDELLGCDYFGRPRPGNEVPVGPFNEGWSTAPRRLRLKPNG